MQKQVDKKNCFSCLRIGEHLKRRKRQTVFGVSLTFVLSLSWQNNAHFFHDFSQTKAFEKAFFSHLDAIPGHLSA
eukprot:COSAG06_NODE_30335_length_540_cov_1.569161_1_plen_74_part_10